MHDSTKSPPASEAASAATAPAAAAKPGPLVLRRGSRIQLGYRTGTVDAVRGAWKKPYEVRVVWDGEKYPQYFVFRTLELEHEQGNLKVL
ncbi:MAG: hypothetical protein HY721_33570 [Planctomycetes bacterium]|nr:hypothetical protein [Planctomycetota bacterium]